MNSAQRRKTKREFPHVIKLVAQGRYFMHDDKVMAARTWCRLNIENQFRVYTFHDHADFKFTEQGDAVHFALIWS
jgi:hypothetical protein